MPPLDIEKIRGWLNQGSQLEKSVGNLGFLMAEGGAQKTSAGQMPNKEIVKGGHLLTAPDLELLEETTTGVPKGQGPPKPQALIMKEGIEGASGFARPNKAKIRTLLDIIDHQKTGVPYMAGDVLPNVFTRGGKKFVIDDVINLLENRKDVLNAIEELAVDLRGNRDGTPSYSTTKTARKNYWGRVVVDHETGEKSIKHTKNKYAGKGFVRKLPKDIDNFLLEIEKVISSNTQSGHAIDKIIEKELANEWGKVNASKGLRKIGEDLELENLMRKGGSKWGTIQRKLEILRQNVHRLRRPETTIPPLGVDKKAFFSTVKEWDPVKEIKSYEPKVGPKTRFAKIEPSSAIHPNNAKIEFTGKLIPVEEYASSRNMSLKEAWKIWYKQNPKEYHKIKKLVKGKKRYKLTGPHADIHTSIMNIKKIKPKVTPDIRRAHMIKLALKHPYKIIRGREPLKKKWVEQIVPGQKLPSKYVTSLEKFQTPEWKIGDTLELSGKIEDPLRPPTHASSTTKLVTQTEVNEYRRLSRKNGRETIASDAEIRKRIEKDPLGWRDDLTDLEHKKMHSESTKAASKGGSKATNKIALKTDDIDYLWKKHDLSIDKVKKAMSGGTPLTAAEKARLLSLQTEANKILNVNITKSNIPYFADDDWLKKYDTGKKPFPFLTPAEKLKKQNIMGSAKHSFLAPESITKKYFPPSFEYYTGLPLKKKSMRRYAGSQDVKTKRTPQRGVEVFKYQTKSAATPKSEIAKNVIHKEGHPLQILKSKNLPPRKIISRGKLGLAQLIAAGIHGIIKGT